MHKLEIELEKVLGMIDDLARERKLLMQWKKDLLKKLGKAARRSELPETRSKKTG